MRYQAGRSIRPRAGAKRRARVRFALGDLLDTGILTKYSGIQRFPNVMDVGRSMVMAVMRMR